MEAQHSPSLALLAVWLHHVALLCPFTDACHHPASDTLHVLWHFYALAPYSGKPKATAPHIVSLYCCIPVRLQKSSNVMLFCHFYSVWHFPSRAGFKHSRYLQSVRESLRDAEQTGWNPCFQKVKKCFQLHLAVTFITFPLVFSQFIQWIEVIC